MRTALCSIVSLMLLSMNSSALARQEPRNCAPDKEVCGIEPRTFECPPCPPEGVQLRTANPEDYRVSLEQYREKIDRDLKVGKIDKDEYKGAIKGYRGAIADYKDIVNDRVPS